MKERRGAAFVEDTVGALAASSASPPMNTPSNPADHVDPGVYIGGFEEETQTPLVIAAVTKVLQRINMAQFLVGDVYAAIPGARGAVVPLVDWRRSSECLNVFRATGPHIALGRKLYCLLRAPESVRNAGRAVDRAATRFSELIGVSRDCLLLHKKTRGILLRPEEGASTLIRVAEASSGGQWRITPQGVQFLQAGGVEVETAVLEAELTRAGML
eukprot:4919506-Alexandrium_andersonii.AAC.1